MLMEELIEISWDTKDTDFTVRLQTETLISFFLYLRRRSVSSSESENVRNQPLKGNNFRKEEVRHPFLHDFVVSNGTETPLVVVWRFYGKQKEDFH